MPEYLFKYNDIKLTVVHPSLNQVDNKIDDLNNDTRPGLKEVAPNER